MTKLYYAAFAAALAGIALAGCQPSAPKTADAGTSCGQSAAPPPAAVGQLQVAPLKWTCRKLANGLRVYSMPDPNTASASVAVWYNVGSKNDPAGRSGFAHLFEHLMFKSTANMPAENMDRLTEDVGGFNNASTTNDYTDYFETVPANHLERVLWAEAERMGSLVVDNVNFQSERKVVEEELRQSVLSNPYGKLFYLYLSQTAFDKHPYGRTTIGSIADLDTATLDDVRAFHAAYYRPDNAVLVISGNFSQAQLDKWVDAYFGPLATPKRDIPKVTTVEPVHTAPRSFTVYEPNVQLPAVAVSWPSPASSDKDHAALIVMDAILSAGQSSRLYQSLIHDQQVASEVNSQFEELQQPGIYSAYAILSNGKTADQGLKALNAEIAKMRDTLVSQAEIDKVKNVLVTQTLNQRETSDGRARELANSVIVFDDPAASDKQLAAIQLVTPADVQRVAKSIFEDNRSITIRYLSDADAKGVKGDTIADAKTIETVKIDIPAAEIPNIALVSEDKRKQPPAAGEPIAAKVPGANEKTLPNGLRVIVASKPGLPLISANLGINAGASLDPPKKAGLASLAADMTTRGTATRSATEIARQVESLGGALSASAGPDSSNVSLGVRADKAKDLFAIFADVVENPAFKAEELDRAKRETLDGLSISLRRPTTVASYAMRRALYGAGPYGLTPSPNSVKSLAREDIAAFHSAWWRPDNAVLVISGDVSTEEGFKLAEDALGGWKKPGAPLPKAPGAPIELAKPGAKPPMILVDIPKVGQAAVLLGQTGPARTDADYFPTLLANEVLGGGYSARLNEEIRIKRGMSYGSSSRFGSRKMGSPILAQTPTANQTVPDVVDLMTGEMGKLASTAIPASEVGARKAVLIGGFGRSVETTGGLAGQYAELAQFGLSLDKLQSYASDIQAVTPDQADAAGKAHFDPAKSAIVVVGDYSVFGQKLEAAHPGFTRIPIDKLNLDSATLK